MPDLSHSRALKNSMPKSDTGAGDWTLFTREESRSNNKNKKD